MRKSSAGETTILQKGCIHRSNAVAIAVDASGVLWLTVGSNKIARVAPAGC
jgi:hypothetical protein